MRWKIASTYEGDAAKCCLFLLQGLIRLPLFYWLGATREAVFAAGGIIGLQGLVSHCNVDLRAGWFNYLFAGTELHRYHHSGDPREAKNFGSTKESGLDSFLLHKHPDGQVLTLSPFTP